MSKLQGTIVTSPITPADSKDTFPTHDAEYGKGGYRSVVNIQERDAIPDKRRTLGMIVRVEETLTEYVLTNTGWIEWVPSGAISDEDRRRLDTVDLKLEKIQIAGVNQEITDHTVNIPLATAGLDGAMRKSDKSKLDGIEAGAQVNKVLSVAGRQGAVVLGKTDVGLGNVDNTSDATKPVSGPTQAALNLKANSADVYKKTETYTRSEVDTKVAGAVSTVYKPKGSKATISEIIALTDAKPGDVWNVEAEFMLSGKKYPASTNVVCVTATSGSSHTDANWDALGGTVDLTPYAKTTDVNTALSGKVDKVTGKGLSDTNFTAAEKTKLQGITSGAQPNVIEGIQYGGTDLAVTGKKVNIPSLAPATSSTLGGIKVGQNLSVDSSGTLSTHAPYSLPKASTTTLGGVKIGANITQAADGTISTHPQYNLPKATTTVLGGVIVGGGMNVDGAGKISIPKASSLVPGLVKIGSGISVTADGTISATGDVQSESAAKLGTPRKINGTDFDGTADIVTSRWGTARTVTIGSKAVSVNGSANVGFSRADMEVTYGQEVGITGPTTAGTWYRIAVSAKDVRNCQGIFYITAATSGRHSNCTVYAGISYISNPSLQQLGCSNYVTPLVTDVRLVYRATTYTDSYSYIDILVNASANPISLNISMTGGKKITDSGWNLQNTLVVADIPEGYTSKTITLVPGAVVADKFIGNLTGNATAATQLKTPRSLWGQPFDGTAIVSGNMTGVGRLQARSRFNEYLATYIASGGQDSVLGTMCITLPNGWSNGMNIYKIDVYENNLTYAASEITVSGYNYSVNGGEWQNYGAHTKGCYTKGVRLGYDNTSGKCVILLGTTTSVWTYPQVFLKSVLNGYIGPTTDWNGDYKISVITDESKISKIVTPKKPNEYFGRINSEIPFNENGEISQFVVNNGKDNFFRQYGFDYVRSQLNNFKVTKKTLDLSGLDQDTYYPCSIPLILGGPTVIGIFVELNSGTKPIWSTHEGGFTLNLCWEVCGSGWGGNKVQRKILNSVWIFTKDSVNPCGGIRQNTSASVEIVYLRGGGKYHYMISNNTAEFTINKDGYSWTSGSTLFTASTLPVTTPYNNSTRAYEDYSMLGVSSVYTNNLNVEEDINVTGRLYSRGGIKFKSRDGGWANGFSYIDSDDVSRKLVGVGLVSTGKNPNYFYIGSGLLNDPWINSWFKSAPGYAQINNTTSTDYIRLNLAVNDVVKGYVGWDKDRGTHIRDLSWILGISPTGNYPTFGNVNTGVFMMPWTKKIGNKGGYERAVILLWKEAETPVQHRITGKIFTSAYGYGRYSGADIDMWYSRWGEGGDNSDYSYRLDTYGCRMPDDNIKFVKCTYNSEVWYALDLESIQAIDIYFQGTYSKISWEKVVYYTATPGTPVVNNAEIKDSIVSLDDKLGVPYIGGSTDRYATQEWVKANSGGTKSIDLGSAINFSDFDSILDSYNTPAHGGIYNLLHKGQPVYQLMIGGDTWGHNVRQILIGNLIVSNGKINAGHTDNAISIVFREYNLTGSGDRNVWSPWKDYLGRYATTDYVDTKKTFFEVTHPGVFPVDSIIETANITMASTASPGVVVYVKSVPTFAWKTADGGYFNNWLNASDYVHDNAGVAGIPHLDRLYTVGTAGTPYILDIWGKPVEIKDGYTLKLPQATYNGLGKKSPTTTYYIVG